MRVLYIGTLSVLRPTRAKAVLAVYRMVMKNSCLQGGSGGRGTGEAFRH